MHSSLSSLPLQRLLPTFSCFLSSSPSCPLCVLWNYSSHGLIISHYYRLSPPLLLSSWLPFFFFKPCVCILYGSCENTQYVCACLLHTCLTLITLKNVTDHESIKYRVKTTFFFCSILIFPCWFKQCLWNWMLVCFVHSHTNLQQCSWFTVSRTYMHVFTHSPSFPEPKTDLNNPHKTGPTLTQLWSQWGVSTQKPPWMCVVYGLTK